MYGLHTPFLSLLYSTVLASPSDLKESKNISVFGRQTQRGEQERAGEDGGPGAARGCMGSPCGSAWATAHWRARVCGAPRAEGREDEGVFSGGEC